MPGPLEVGHHLFEATRYIKELVLRNEAYFIQEALSQKTSYPDFDKIANVVCAGIKTNLAQYKLKYGKEFISLDDKNNILRSIYEAIADREFTLTENAWKNIDLETDLEILESIFYYVSINIREIKFWSVRKFFLENKEFWSYLKC